MLLFLSLSLAFCSLVYEFVLSHLLAALLGGMLIRYTTTVALYITSLGVGAYLLDRVFRLKASRDPLSRAVRESSGESLGGSSGESSIEFSRGALWGALLRVELMLALAGGVAPLLALMSASLPAFVMQWCCYMLVCGVGVLSGFELPILMRLGELQKKNYGLKVLSVDFVGTCVGCVVFPLVLLPYLGVFYTAALVSSVNLLLAGVVRLKYCRPQQKRVPQNNQHNHHNHTNQHNPNNQDNPNNQKINLVKALSSWVLGRQNFKAQWPWYLLTASHIAIVLLILFTDIQSLLLEMFYLN